MRPPMKDKGRHSSPGRGVATLRVQDLIEELRSEFNDKVSDLHFHLQDKFDAEVATSAKLKLKLEELEAGQSALRERLTAEVPLLGHLHGGVAELQARLSAEISGRQSDIQAVRGELGRLPRAAPAAPAAAESSESFAGFFSRGSACRFSGTQVSLVERVQGIETRMAGTEARMANLEELSSSRRKVLEKLQEQLQESIGTALSLREESAKVPAQAAQFTQLGLAQLQSRLEVLEQASQRGAGNGTGVGFHSDAAELHEQMVSLSRQVEELSQNTEDTASKLGQLKGCAKLFTNQFQAAKAVPRPKADSLNLALR